VDKREGEQTVTIAPPPVQLIPKSIATPSLLAHIVTAKFSDSIPLYRQERQFKRYGIEISRSTMCDWLVKVWERGKPLIELLITELLSGPLIGVDETRHQVLKEHSRAPSSLSYIWIFLGVSRAGPVYYFHYNPSRSGEVAAKILKGYQGVIQTDGYGGYNFLDSRIGVVHAGCWAHARRKFMDVAKAVGKKKTNNKAEKALRLIGKLYHIEREAKESGLTEEQLLAKRQSESKPIVAEYESFIKENASRVLPRSLLGRAILYSAGQMPHLKAFLENAIIPLDTNLVENAIRPFAVGRKNWLCVSRRRFQDENTMLAN
jgi:transposase